MNNVPVLVCVASKFPGSSRYGYLRRYRTFFSPCPFVLLKVVVVVCGMWVSIMADTSPGGVRPRQEELWKSCY